MTHALIVIDVQNDFCPGGALAVTEGDTVVPRINAMMEDAGAVVLTQDWHPAGHGSFASSHAGKTPMETITLPYGEQVLWPDHCVQGSAGAAFHPGLRTDPADLILRKGTNPAIDSYSAFFENDRITPTGLDGWLCTRGITAVTLAGLATDFCVQFSALDAARLGFRTEVALDACRGIDLGGSMDAALTAMRGAGVTLTER
ncbi:MAG: bifunctional nicotinamidase/pyrazinamidase [Celeribacter sp.]|jgi:nicotinamidase/pyrazinamidase